MKNRQGLTIAALIVAIIGLSIGFAAFSNTLNISSTASVNPDASSLKVVFANNTDVNNLNIDPVQVYSASTGASGTPGTINNEAQNGPTLTGLKASFTQPGQSVVYKLNVVNAGKLKAYLTDIVFGTTGNPAASVSCTAATKDSNNQDIPAAEQATESLVNAACQGISISVKIGELEAKTSSGSLNNLELNVAGYKEVVIIISYASGSAYVDGPMNVAFGDIEINAKSVGTQSQGGGEQPSVDTSEFISTEQGVLTGYNGSSSNIVIPDGLRLPVTTQTATFNPTKCKNNLPSDWIEEGSTVEDTCEEMGSSMQSASAEDVINMGMSDFFDIISTSSQEDYLITSIDEYIFQDKNITSVSIGNSIITIGDYAFNLNSISTLDLSGATSLTTIGNNAFSSNSISSVTIPSSVTTIGHGAFNQNSISTLDLSSATSLTTIGNSAFSNNNMSSVTIPSSVTTISGAFFSGNHLTSVTMYPTKQTLESQINYGTFGYSETCFDDSQEHNPVTNRCITWVNG